MGINHLCPLKQERHIHVRLKPYHSPPYPKKQRIYPVTTPWRDDHDHQPARSILAHSSLLTFVSVPLPPCRLACYFSAIYLDWLS